jgi:hypothetical protein
MSNRANVRRADGATCGARAGGEAGGNKILILQAIKKLGQTFRGLEHDGRELHPTTLLRVERNGLSVLLGGSRVALRVAIRSE